MFGPVRCVGTRSDAFGYTWVRLEAFGHFQKFQDFSDDFGDFWMFIDPADWGRFSL